MDPLILMLLTVFLNAIVTGVVVYAIQKRIERTNSQRIFEDQLKFKMHHEKRTETLENIYQKFSSFSDELQDILGGSYISEGHYRVNDRRLSESKKKIYDIEIYFESNRIFLPDAVNKDIFSILNSGDAIVLVITILFVDSISKSNAFYDMVNDGITHIEGVDELDLEKPNYSLLYSQIMEELIDLKIRLERIYKLNS